ncbi:MAG TPA: FtsX-like permease family protein [Bacteroidales bacterium]|nr:FtsX-like permease family protein [Bacteroidales bacterium]
MEIVKIAWRNVWRNKARSLVILVSVCIGMVGGIFATAAMIGMMDQRVDNAIETEISHIQLHNPKFIDNQEQEYYISNTDDVVNKIAQSEYVSGVSRRLKITAMISSAETATGVVINGVIPSEEKKVSDLHTRIIKGNYFTGNKSNEIVISQRMAEKLKLDIKSKLVLTFQDANGDIVSDSYKICGIYNTKNQMYDEMEVFVKMDHLNKICGYDENVAQEIAVLLKNNEQLTEAATEIKALVGNNISVRKWKEISPDLGMMTDMMAQYSGYILLIILMALAFGIINTMLMAILERKKELGMMMAIGMNKAKIREMIVWETVFLTFTGTIMGVIIAQVLVSYFGRTGIDLTMYAEGFESIGYDAVLYPALNLGFYVQIVVLTVFTAFFSAIFPMRRAIKMNPAEVLRTE